MYFCKIIMNIQNSDFWQTISNTIVEFNLQHPELAERAEKFAMLRPSYTKSLLEPCSIIYHQL